MNVKRTYEYFTYYGASIVLTMLPFAAIVSYIGYNASSYDKFTISDSPISEFMSINNSIDHSVIFANIIYALLSFFLIPLVIKFRRFIKPYLVNKSKFERIIANIGLACWFFSAGVASFIGFFPVDLDKYIHLPAIPLYDLHCVGGYGLAIGVALGLPMMFYSIYKSKLLPKKLVLFEVFIYIFGLSCLFLWNVLFEAKNIGNVAEWIGITYLACFFMSVNYYLFRSDGNKHLNWNFAEIFLGLFFLFAYIFLIIPVYSSVYEFIGLMPLVVLILLSVFVHRENYADFKLKGRSFNRTLLCSLAAILLLVLLTFLVGKNLLPANFIPSRSPAFCLDIFACFLSAAAQLVVLFMFFFRRLNAVVKSRYTGVFLTSLIFSFIYVPNFKLMIIYFLCGIIFLIIYSKWYNLIPIIIFFGVLKVCLFMNLFGVDLYDGNLSYLNQKIDSGIININNHCTHEPKFNLFRPYKEVVLKGKPQNLLLSFFLHCNADNLKVESVSIACNDTVFPVSSILTGNNIRVFNMYVSIANTLRFGNNKLYLTAKIRDITKNKIYIYHSNPTILRLLSFDRVDQINPFYPVVNEINKSADKIIIITNMFKSRKLLKYGLAGKCIKPRAVYNPTHPEYFKDTIRHLYKEGYSLFFIMLNGRRVRPFARYLTEILKPHLKISKIKYKGFDVITAKYIY